MSEQSAVNEDEAHQQLARASVTGYTAAGRSVVDAKTKAQVQKVREAPRTFFLIQVMRAFAAILVVVYHGTLALQGAVDPRYRVFAEGGIGVDVFFVISGFVMTLSSASLKRDSHPMRTFVARRLERIVPLYWIITTIQILTILIAPSLMNEPLNGPWRVIASYLFLPLSGFPIVNQGWTLNYEMFFYVLFAIALALKVRPFLFISPVLIALSIVYHFVPKNTTALARLCDPIMLEFLFGIALALLITQPRLRHAKWLWIASLCAMPVFVVAYHLRFLGRPTHWGVPALILVVVAVLLEPALGSKVPKWMLELGDASYSIYLIHVLLLAFIFPLWRRSGVPGFALETTLLIAYVVLATAVGVVCYRVVETPIMRYFRGRRRAAVPASALTSQ